MYVVAHVNDERVPKMGGGGVGVGVGGVGVGGVFAFHAAVVILILKFIV